MSAVAGKSGYWRRIAEAPGLPAAIFLAGLLFLFVPAQIYGGNAPYFPYSFGQYLSVLGLAFLAAAVLGALAVSAGNERWRRGVGAAMSGIAVAAWAGATFLVMPERLLDGQSALRPAVAAAGWKPLLLLAVLAVGCLAAWRWPVKTGRFLAAFFAVLAANVAWLAVSDDKNASGFARAPAERLVSLSAHRNVLVLVLDSLQSDFFTELLRRDPGLAAALDGFTFYPHAVSPAPSTYLSIPVLHSGAYFLEGGDLRRVYREGVVRDSFLAQVSDRGFDSMLVNPVLGACPRGTTCVDAGELIHGHFRRLLDSASFVVGLAIFRIVPEGLRPAAYRKGWLSALSFGDIDDASSSNAVLELLASGAHDRAPTPVARFIHLFNTHAPARLDAQCRSVDGEPWTREAALAQDQCALGKVARLLKALRDRNLYDNTAIAIVADHGRAFPPPGAPELRWGSAASPLLLLKPFGERGALKISGEVAGLADVPASLCAWTQACRVAAGQDLAGGARGEPRYPFVAYEWRHEYWNRSKVPVENRFELRGAPDRVASWWRLTNTPPPEVRSLEFGSSDPGTAYGYGWGLPEAGGGMDWRWSIGGESDLYFDLDPSGDARIEVVVSTHAGNSAQSVAVEVNGEAAGSFPVPAGWSRHEVVVPGRLLRPGPDRVLFRPTEFNRPTGDSRALAVRFEKLSIR